jgi:hypothetical protein
MGKSGQGESYLMAERLAISPTTVTASDTGRGGMGGRQKVFYVCLSCSNVCLGVYMFGGGEKTLGSGPVGAESGLCIFVVINGYILI